jgi:hypothetical protein
MMAMGVMGMVRIAPNLNPDEDAVMPVMPRVVPVMFHVPALVLPRVTRHMAINMRPGAVMRRPLHMGARLRTWTGLRRYTQQEHGTCQDDSGNELFQHTPLLYWYWAIGFGCRFGLRPDSSLALEKRSSGVIFFALLKPTDIGWEKVHIR